ncbi:dTDP-4-dehydrorhamnose 3,5-epimerase [Brevundimonas sp. Root1423]|nr:dTDP-4-dehydrorhamnose 3,5-epimerase [Brevundimonas sp. Root1423]
MANVTITSATIPDVKIVQPRKFEDARGHFLETYSFNAFADHGLDILFVQDNQSLSTTAGTLRGLHYQLPPFAQDKLVRVTRGRIWDVAVDIRRSSPTFRQWFGIELSDQNQTQLLVPKGFAHGFVTLVPDTEVVYKVSAPYSGPHDAGVAWDDPELKVAWPPLADQPVLSAKDCSQPVLADAILFD